MFSDHWKHSTEMSSRTCLRCFWVLCRGVTQHSKGLALSSFVFFFFLKRNVSHLGFIFVFSEDYFLFSPFSFFWEDRLFTVDYRQKCCSPSYETAFFFPQEEVLLHLLSQIPLLVQADSASAQQPEVADACKWGGTCAANICWRASDADPGRRAVL